MVYAVDALTGKLLWQFDPGVTKVAGKKLRAGAGVRGLAYSTGRLFVGTHDGRLIALDAKKGTRVWSTPTLDANDATSSPARRACSRAKSRSASAIRARRLAA